MAALPGKPPQRTRLPSASADVMQIKVRARKRALIASSLHWKLSMKILLAADGSSFTRIAARHLTTHLDWFAGRPEIHILHVRPPLPYARAAATAAGKAAIRELHRSASEAALDVAQTELARGNVPYIPSWRVGEVAGEIAKYAKAHGIDLIVMGSRGHGALAGLALGSVATKCIATVMVPIVIVRASPPPRLTRRERIYGPRKAGAQGPQASVPSAA
jgi:nucleotide-binding universal stress UspA family protein